MEKYLRLIACMSVFVLMYSCSRSQNLDVSNREKIHYHYSNYKFNSSLIPIGKLLDGFNVCYDKLNLLKIETSSVRPDSTGLNIFPWFSKSSFYENVRLIIYRTNDSICQIIDIHSGKSTWTRCYQFSFDFGKICLMGKVNVENPNQVEFFNGFLFYNDSVSLAFLGTRSLYRLRRDGLEDIQIIYSISDFGWPTYRLDFNMGRLISLSAFEYHLADSLIVREWVQIPYFSFNLEKSQTYNFDTLYSKNSGPKIGTCPYLPHINEDMFVWLYGNYRRECW